MKHVKAYESFKKETVQEALDQKEVMNILDAAAMFADDAEVAADQTWKDRNDLIKYLLSDHIAKKDHQKFLKYVGESDVNEATDSEMRDAIRTAEEKAIILRDKESEIRAKADEATEKGDSFQEEMLRMDLKRNRLEQQIAQIDIEKLQQKYRRNNE